tara:strand:+ start:342 stop:533 length:192 start_codon:yes stop_codon:yes gene_type:complete
MRNIIETGTSLMGNDYEWRLVKVRPVVAEEEAGGLETTEEEEEEEEEEEARSNAREEPIFASS